MGKTGQVKTGESPTGDQLQQNFSASITSTSVVQTAISGVTLNATVDPFSSIQSDFASSDRVATVQPEAEVVSEPTAATAGVDLGEKWQVVRDQTHIETGVFDVRIVDTANPFGNYAIAKIDDVQGTKFDDYTRGTRVDFNYSTNNGISYTSRFTGFVVETRELDNQGADALEIECYSFDQFLRRDSVTNDQTGNLISDALEDIIKTDTPVDWNASLVHVEDDGQELTESYRGDKVENALQSLASKSSNEDFGVTDNLEFFFRPREANEAPRDIDNSQWFNYDIPEEGKRTINEVTVYFNDGSESVTVDDGSDKQDLQESIGTSDPITFAEEVSRPDITNVDDARAVAEQILDGKETTLTGTVTTYGLVDAEPGDVINIEIVPRGISGDFRIAEIEYRWGDAQTIITVVEKRGDQDDLLVNLSDTLKRVELGDVNRDAPNTRVTSTYLELELATSGDVDGVDVSSSRFTNVGLNLLRDTWAESSTLNITDIAVGNDPTQANREQTSLGNELERVSATDSVVDATTIDFSGTFSTSDVREVGLFTSSGDMVARATVPDEISSSTPTATIRVSADNGNGNGVVTENGQQLARETIDGSASGGVTRYAYGDDGTEPTESDMDLGNTLISEVLDSTVIQSAFDNADFNELVSFADDEPVEVRNNSIELLQTGWFAEAENTTFTGTTVNKVDYSGPDPDGVRLGLFGDLLEWTFTPEHDIPDGQFFFGAWGEFESFDGTLSYYFEGNQVGSTAYGGVTTSYGRIGATGVSVGRLEAGTTYTIRYEITDHTAGDVDFDAVWAVDEGDRYGGFGMETTNPNFDSANEGTVENPALYPDEYIVQFPTVETRRTVTEASVNSNWNNVDNNQRLEFSNDGGNTWQTVNNSQTGSVTFNSADRDVDFRIALSRYQNDATTSPRAGDGGQIINNFTLRANPEAVTPDDVGTLTVRSIIDENTLSAGTTLREAGQATGPSDVVTRSTFAEFDVEADQTIQSAETLVFKNP